MPAGAQGVADPSPTVCPPLPLWRGEGRATAGVSRGPLHRRCEPEGGRARAKASIHWPCAPYRGAAAIAVPRLPRGTVRYQDIAL